MYIETTLAHIVLFICAVVGILVSLVQALDLIQTNVELKTEVELQSEVAVLDRTHGDGVSLIFWGCVTLAVFFLVVAATGRSWANIVLIGYAVLFAVLGWRRRSKSEIEKPKLDKEDVGHADGHGWRQGLGFVSLIMHVGFLVIAVMEW